VKAPLVASTVLVALLSCTPVPTDGAPVATIKVSSAVSGSSLGGRFVEGRMTFRDRRYLLILRGVAESAITVGSVRGMLTARDIEGIYEPSNEGLRNAAGVTIRFDPPLTLAAGKLEIEVESRLTPKISGGHRESGVD
jgi:hypothetical protein